MGDVVLLDKAKDVGATNRRHLAALHCDEKSGFEAIHGLVFRVMEIVSISWVHDDGVTVYPKKFDIVPSNEPEYLHGRQGSIIVDGKHVGTFGIVHPEVLKNFDIPFPCSYTEVDVEYFL